ncbi:hypothetical protein HN51_035968, partial [Arachis hypogaea]
FKLNIKSQNLNKRGGKRQENSRSSDTSRKIENKTEDRKQYSPCDICKKTNHLEKDCWHRGKQRCCNCKRFEHMKKDCKMKINHGANFSEEKEGEECLFYASSQEDNHITDDQSLLSDINKSVQFGIILGDRMIVQANGKGTIIVHTKI